MGFCPLRGVLFSLDSRLRENDGVVSFAYYCTRSERRLQLCKAQ
jgi:hypothetical protein